MGTVYSYRHVREQDGMVIHFNVFLHSLDECMRYV